MRLNLIRNKNIILNKKGSDFMKEQFKELDTIELSNKELTFLEKINKRYEKKRRRALIKLEIRKRKYQLRKINKEYKVIKKKKKRQTTKIIIAFILCNCTIVEIYSMFVMLYLKDLTALYSLIGAVVGESISFAVYCVKSYKETKEEAINKLERDKFMASIETNNEEEYIINRPEEDNRDLSEDEKERK